MSASALLDAGTVATLVAELPGWTVSDDGKRLRRTIRFEDFDAAFDFVAGVAALARTRDHHPDVEFGWGYATISLTTHDAGGLTRRDVVLASDISGIAPV